MKGGARRLGTRLVALGENTQNLKRLASSTPALYSALLSGWLPGRQECVRGGMKTGWKKKKGTHTDSCQALVSLSLPFPKAEEEGLVEGGTEEETESRRHHAPPTPPPPKKLKTFCLHTLCVSKEPLAYGIARINYRPTWRDLFCILSDALSRRSD